MAVVEFKVEKLQARIKAMGARSKNLPMDLLGQIMADAIDDVIDSEGKAGTQGKWDPFVWERETGRRPDPRRVGGKLLQDIGLLANIQVDAGQNEVLVGSPAPYAHFHLVEGPNRPVRDFLAIDFDAVLEEISDVVTREITG